MKTIWQLIERNMRHMERLKLRKVEQVEESDLYLGTFEAHLDAPFEYVKFDSVFVFRIRDERDVYGVSTETIDPSQKLYDDEEENEETA